MILLTVLSLALVPAGCARQDAARPDTPAPATEDAAQQSHGGIPKPVIIGAVVLVAVVALALATARSDPFLDYSDICGTPDCS